MHAILSSKCEPFRFSSISENSEIRNQRHKSCCMIIFGSYHVIHKRLNIIGKLLYLWTQQPSDWHWFLSIHSIFQPNDLVSYKLFYSLWYHLRFESTDRNRFEKSEQKKAKNARYDWPWAARAKQIASWRDVLFEPFPKRIWINMQVWWSLITLNDRIG